MPEKLSEQRKFKLHWKGNSEEEVVEGIDITDEFRRAGYSLGALNAIDWFEEIF